MTACKDCANLINLDNQKIWHGHYCQAVPCEEIFDAYEGKKVPINDPPFAHCRDVNTAGNCPHFKKAALLTRAKRVL